MSWRIISAAMVFSGGMSGCYVETIDDQRDNIRGERPSADQRIERGAGEGEVGQCRFTAQKGCFDGHVISKKEFLVEGKAFFNADDLATRFGELITVERLGTQLRDGEDYRFELLTPMDNPSFLQGFEYYLIGSTVRSGNVRNNGVFNVNELGEGSYDLRLQKTIKFQVVGTVVKPPTTQVEPTAGQARPVEQPAGDEQAAEEPAEQPAGEAADQPAGQQPQQSVEPVTEAVTKTFCATIYTDTTIDVRRGERLWQPFNEFRLHLTDRDCPAAGSGRVVTL
jgi:hypothetical protein